MSEKKKILIADINLMRLEFLKEKLDAPNVEVTTAYGGHEARKWMNMKNFDLLITALDMPYPNGYHLLKHFKSQNSSKPVIIYSKVFLDEEPSKKTFIDLGSFFAVGLPLALNNLYEAIEIALSFGIDSREKRRYPRLPVQLDFSAIESGEPFCSLKDTHTDNISLGGFRFELTRCKTCTGYRPGGVHPQCIFYKYDYKNEDSQPFEIALKLSPKRVVSRTDVDEETKIMRLKVKVAYIIQEPNSEKEHVGCKFVQIEPQQRNELKDFLRLFSLEQKEIIRKEKEQK